MNEGLVAKELAACGMVPISIQPVGKGGSARSFWRVQTSKHRRVIFISYDANIRENTLYAGIAAFLAASGVSVPALLGDNPTGSYLILQDLGDDDLYTTRSHDSATRYRFYEQAITEIARLHCISLEHHQTTLPPLMPPFDEGLYRWEREYFWQYFFRVFVEGAAYRIPPPVEQELSLVAQKLLLGRPVLIHRDLQSQNVMIQREKCYLIDFQGLRLGNPLYDIASLLFDPYVEIAEDCRTNLLEYYLSLTDKRFPLHKETLLLAATQRLLQALGAYGFLSRERDKKHFLAYIPPAIKNLQGVLKALACCPALTKLIDGIDKKRLQMQIDRHGQAMGFSASLDN
ncbi:MAG: phosphotransferase [Deltaproteobacteria bacterium]|nr:phosphotransferase [Deltaproteobacteria bacterium]